MPQPQLEVKWVKNNQNNEWFDLLKLNLESKYFIDKKGVYVIWYVSSPSKAVRVGSGNIAERLKEHRANAEITKYSSFGPLKVTWAIVGEESIKGVETYLGRKYSPIIGGTFPSTTEISVNLIGS
jgi:hypothetical protein